LILLASDRPADALTYLKAASALQPLDSSGHLYLGLALAALNQKAQARIELQRALSISTDPAITELAKARLESLNAAPLASSGQPGGEIKKSP
jgi:Tfp pilus assembly protein PilF